MIEISIAIGSFLVYHPKEVNEEIVVIPRESNNYLDIKIGVLALEGEKYSNYLEVSDTCTAVKKEVKQQVGSNFMLDRRRKN